ncbi:cation diffusion facilitator family transporter [Bacillus badius]|uniref:Cobalt-zinc-cadmium resistance protein n=1 Tax=Bacillus badius TaxID=1455 RepID=A0ABR5AUE6_BACBA|nr:cation diffusion facilitator family transporter [Bacillus badius]KIL75436.1 Cobalt-zinc-cadmium resistance protein [Bacillus badius]KIL78001.1 Cobalt-zinc-cadmium resistance protein [Bacillus badius]KZR58409.1 cation transporter [Bacillus badius]MED4716430.1 cation diffusion facilitator family transporter [Bacillus badius]
METEERFKKAEFAAIIGIVGNIFLTVFKGICGYIGNSRALIADAAHSASDIAGSLAVWIGLRAAKRPPDEDHPYGHGKAESIAAIIVAILLVIVGIEIGISSIKAFFQTIEPPKAIAVYAVLLSIVIKEGMFQYKYRLGKRLKSDALIANAYEHRSDVYSSVAALIGIGAALLGGKLGIEWLVYGDPVAGLLVSLLVLKIAWKVGKESIHSTMDHVLHDEHTKELREAVLSVPDVRQINSLYAREHGHYVVVDLKIAVDPLITVEEGHSIGKKVKNKLLSLPDVQDAFIHINPDRPSTEGKK